MLWIVPLALLGGSPDGGKMSTLDELANAPGDGMPIVPPKNRIVFEPVKLTPPAAVAPVALERHFRQHRTALLGCYEQRLKSEPTLSGAVRITFEITPMGRSEAIAVAGDSIGGPKLASCLKAVIGGWVFAFKSEQALEVELGIRFLPGRG